MEPADFLHHFAVYGPVTGAAVFPFDLASTVMVAITTYSAVESHRPGRRAWTLATVGMVGTLLVLPIYFVDANLAIVRPCFPTRGGAHNPDRLVSLELGTRGSGPSLGRLSMHRAHRRPRREQLRT
ncbi:hypothetical protein W59_24240 [Rhodococcus opacus RKJ300 = JCM 13270]|uniref:Uncharacterized protein n=1 Tax=Rhodococcus opacus RKJ300 = JCM 13270 TaxID=1165867 RepID=I0WLX0_RHOOP|nr:hypothetical protein W59_24240 [Rhodococcus opacus RKJ300 = JCM 13270]